VTENNMCDGTYTVENAPGDCGPHLDQNDKQF
jgi:hypothetical protein